MTGTVSRWSCSDRDRPAVSTGEGQWPRRDNGSVTLVLPLLAAAASLLGLGLVMGTSPTLYAIVIRLLTSSTSGSRATAAVRWMLLGVALGSTVLLLVFRVVDPRTLTFALRDDTEKLLVSSGIDLLAGLVFLVLGFRELRRLRRPRTPHRAKASRDPAHERRPGRLVLMGAANALIGVSGMATMYVTGRVITGASHDLAIQAGLFGIFLVAVLGPYLALALAWERFPAFARLITRVLDRISATDTRPLLAAGLLAAAVAFLALGIWGHGHLPGLLARLV